MSRLGSCSSCRHFWPNAELNVTSDGSCRRRAPYAMAFPIINPMGQMAGMNKISYWPEPKKDQSCSEYEPRLAEAK